MATGTSTGAGAGSGTDTGAGSGSGTAACSISGGGFVSSGFEEKNSVILSIISGPESVVGGGSVAGAGSEVTVAVSTGAGFGSATAAGSIWVGISGGDCFGAGGSDSITTTGFGVGATTTGLGVGQQVNNWRSGRILMQNVFDLPQVGTVQAIVGKKDNHQPEFIPGLPFIAPSPDRLDQLQGDLLVLRRRPLQPPPP